MKPNQFAQLTKKSSTTFYLASLLFPPDIRNDVFVLYSFVRIADDLIDSIPPKETEFLDYWNQTKKAFAGTPSNNVFVDTFVALAHKYDIPFSLVDDFFTTQHADAQKRSMDTYEELERFVYGVAEVIGLMMARIMQLPKESYESARTLGRAMQLVNIIRDIDEDRRAGKRYIPMAELSRWNLPATLSKEVASKNPAAFRQLIDFQTQRIERLISEARAGFTYIPKAYLVPIKTSADLYELIIRRINHNPFLIFEKKIKPSRFMILKTLMKNYFQSL